MNTQNRPSFFFLPSLLLAMSLLSSGASAQGLTREQVKADLEQARSSGELITIHNGKTLKELSPHAYAKETLTQGKTRAQVMAELVEAQRTGDIRTIHNGRTEREMNPSAFPRSR